MTLPTSSEERSPRRKGINSRLLFLGVVIAISLAVFQFRHTDVARERVLSRLQSLPEFSLSTSEGKGFSLHDLKGKLWVIRFLDIDHAKDRLEISRQIQQLQSFTRQSKAHEVGFLSIAADSQENKIKSLTDALQALGEDLSQQVVLTGKLVDIQSLIEEGFPLPLNSAKETSFPRSTQLLLLDDRGVVRGNYEGTSSDVVQKILMDIGALVREQKKIRPRSKSLP